MPRICKSVASSSPAPTLYVNVRYVHRWSLFLLAQPWKLKTKAAKRKPAKLTIYIVLICSFPTCVRLSAAARPVAVMHACVDRSISCKLQTCCSGARLARADTYRARFFSFFTFWWWRRARQEPSRPNGTAPRRFRSPSRASPSGPDNELDMWACVGVSDTLRARVHSRNT